ncbi:WecB/TagA/CpsF family glycosyltransferase [Candidatus Uhrbacteria bacterium]|nr:WecB/TagA/CpsF family glycosyltransferase [Candidatus Uhrbacteria bacterium]
MKPHYVFDVRIDDISGAELQQQLQSWICDERWKMIVTTNAEFLLLTRKNKTFHDRLNQSDLSLPDSVSLRYAVAALTDSYLGHRHPGVDVLQDLARLCLQNSKRLLLLGGDSGVAQATAMRLRQHLLELDVVAIDPGVISYNGTDVAITQNILDQIKNTAPDVVAVALGQGKQEAFMFQAKEVLPNVRIWIGVGGALDMLSGSKRRSPSWMQKIGLEFVWRLIREPRRVRRIVNASIIFPFAVALSTLRSRRFLKAVSRVFPEVHRQLKGL